MGIDIETLALARKYADKIASGGTPSNTYSKEEIDKKINDAITSEIDISQLVQTDDGEFILFGGDSST